MNWLQWWLNPKRIFSFAFGLLAIIIGLMGVVYASILATIGEDIGVDTTIISVCCFPMALIFAIIGMFLWFDAKKDENVVKKN